jgi:hypothetical protein
MVARYAIVAALIFTSASGCAYTFQSGNRKVDREWRRIEDQTAGPAKCCVIAGATAAVVGLWAWLSMETGGLELNSDSPAGDGHNNPVP